jgi:zinc protease
LLEYRLPADYYQTLIQKTLAVTTDEANSLAHKEIQPDRQIWIIVGDLNKIESGIRDMQVAEVRKIDADGNPAP